VNRKGEVFQHRGRPPNHGELLKGSASTKSGSTNRAAERLPTEIRRGSSRRIAPRAKKGRPTKHSVVEETEAILAATPLPHRGKNESSIRKYGTTTAYDLFRARSNLFYAKTKTESRRTTGSKSRKMVGELNRKNQPTT